MRYFADQSKKNVQKKPKKEESPKEPASEKDEENVKFTHDPNKDKIDDENMDSEQNQAQFKSYRRVMFMLGKTIKWTIWAGLAGVLYHLVLVKRVEKPEQSTIVNSQMLEAARTVDWAVYAAQSSMTKPWMTKMLPDRPNIPGY